MAAFKTQRCTSSHNNRSNKQVKRIRRRKGVFALAAAAGAVTLFGFGRWAKADTFSFAFDTDNSFDNGGAGILSTDLSLGTNWYDLNATTGNASFLGATNSVSAQPGINDTAQFDAYFAGLNQGQQTGGSGSTSAQGGPPSGAGNDSFTLSTTQATTWGALNILSPGEGPMWFSGGSFNTTNAFVMTITGSNAAAAALAIGSGGITVTNDINGFNSATTTAPANNTAFGNASGVDVVINAPMSLLASQTWNIQPVAQTLANTVSFSQALTIASGNNLNIGTNGAQVLSITGGGNVTIGARIIDAGSPNGSQITVNNAGGIVTLNCPTNTFSGGLNLEAGTVSVSNVNSLGTNGSGINFDGGTLFITGTAVNNLNAFEVNGSSNGTPVVGNSGSGLGATSTWSGFNLNLDISNGGDTFIVAQNLTGTLQVNTSGGGTVVLSNPSAQNFSGGVNIGAGSTLIALAPGNLGVGPLTNLGTLEFAQSGTASGSTYGVGALLATGVEGFGGSGFGSTLTLTNVSGQISNQAVGATSFGTLILDFSQGTPGTPIVAGLAATTLGPNLDVAGGNIIFVAGSTPATQIFATTTFSGGLPSTVQVAGNQTVGNLTIQLGVNSFGAGYTSLVRSSSDGNPQYGSVVDFSGPLGNVGVNDASPFIGAAPTGTAESDYIVTGNTFTAPSAILGGAGNNNYYNGYATYGLSDWAAITLPNSAGTSYIVPGSAIGTNSVVNGTGFYTPISLGARASLTPVKGNLNPVFYYSVNRETPALENDNVDINEPFAARTGGNGEYGTLRFNSPTGGFTTAGGNSMLTLLGNGDYENGAFLITPNIGTMNVLFANSTDDIISNISSAGQQDFFITRGTDNEGTIWNNDYQGFTAGMFIMAESFGEKAGDPAGMTLISENPAGPAMYAFVGSNYYLRATSIDNAVLQIQTDQDLGGNDDANGTNTQGAVDLNSGTLITNGSIPLNNSFATPFNSTLVSRQINISLLNGTLASVANSTMSVTGPVVGAGNLQIGFGTYMKVNEGATSTLGLVLSQGSGTVVLSGTNTGFIGDIAITNGATLQTDGSYSPTTDITVANGNLIGTTASTLSSITVNSGSGLFPGDNKGNGGLTVNALALNSGSTLGFAIQGGINAGVAATDVLSSTTTPTSNISGFLSNSASGGLVNLSIFQTSSVAPFFTNGTFDLMNVLGNSNAFNVNGTLAVPNGITSETTSAVDGFIMTNPELVTTYALSTFDNVGGNETELILDVNSAVIQAGWNNPSGGNWGTPSNWNPATVPNGPVDIALFPSLSNAASIPVTITAPETAGLIEFFQTNTFTNSYAISTSGTGSLAMTNGSQPGEVLSLSGSDTINAAISAPIGLEVATTNAADTITMGGAINGAGQSVTINGTTSTVTGSGTVVFAATEGYTGPTYIAAGTLQLGNGTVAGSIVNSSNVVNNGNITFQEPSGNTYTFAQSMTGTTGSGSITQNGPNTLLILDPSVPYTNNQNANGTNNLTINAPNGTAATVQLGSVSGGILGTVTINGNSKLDLNGTNNVIGLIQGTGFIDNTSSTPVSLQAENSNGNSTWSGVIENTNTAGTVTFDKNGLGLLVFAPTSVNTYSGETLINGGSLQITASNNIPANNTLAIAQTNTINGPLILGNGVTFANPIVYNGGSNEFVTVAPGGVGSPTSAFLSGPVTIQGGGNQYRLGTNNTLSTLYVTGADTAQNSGIFAFFEGGSMVLLQNYSLTVNTGVNQFIFDRSSLPEVVSLNGNASINDTGTGGVSMGTTSNTFNPATVSFTMNSTAGGNNPVANFGSQFFELDGSAGANVLNQLTINGGTLEVGALGFDPVSSVANLATAIVNFNGGIVVAGASNANFLPGGTLGQLQLNVGNGGAKFDTNGFTEVSNSGIGFTDQAPNETLIGGLEKDGAGQMIFGANFGDNANGEQYGGATVVNGGLLEFAGPLIQGANNVDNLQFTTYIQVAAGGAIGEDDGITSNSSSNMLNALTNGAAPNVQFGGLAISTPDAAVNFDYSGTAVGTQFEMNNAGDGANLTNMSIGAVMEGGADIGSTGNPGTLGVPVIYTGTITPSATGTWANTYLLGGGGTLELTNVNAITNNGATPRNLLAENGGSVYLASSNNYTGNTTIQGIMVAANTVTGTTQLETTTLAVNGLSPTDSGLGASGNGSTSKLLISGGVLQYLGSTNESSNAAFTVGELGAGLDSSGTGSINFSNTGQEAFSVGDTGTITFSLSGSNGTVGTVQSIEDGTAPLVNVFAGSFTAPNGVTLSLVKNGIGAWDITGDSYNGGAAINNGVLQLGANGALNTAGGMVSIGSTVNGTVVGVLDMNGFNASIGALNGNGTIDNLTNTTSGSTLTIVAAYTASFTAGAANTNTAGTYSGIIQNSNGTTDVALSITGGGNQVLSGSSNSFGGGTYIDTGTTLTLTGTNGGVAGTAPIGSGNISDAGTLIYSRTDATLSFANNISGTGSFAMTSGSLVMTGNNTYSGQTIINGGTMVIPSTTGLSPNTSGIINNSNLLILAGVQGAPVTLGQLSENLTTVTLTTTNTGTGNLIIGNASGTTGYALLHTNSHTSVVSGLTVNAGSTLDIGNNTLSIDYGAGTTPMPAILAALSAGYNSGTWTGTSAVAGVITSSTAAAGAPGGKPVLSVGYSDGNFDQLPSSNAAPSATAGQILVKMTLAGDAFLVGTVNFNDLDIVGKHLNTSGNDWAQGNFNYDPNGATNFNDLDIVGQNLNTTLGSLGSSGDELGGTTLPLGLAAGASVASDDSGVGAGDSSPVGQSVSVAVQTTIVTPEPGTLCLLAAGAGSLLARRRRRTSK